MKFKFSYIIAIAAFFVAGCAAYYSVFGLSQLFAGARFAVIVMASSLEFAKIIGVSLLQRYWTKLSKWLRIYISIGMFILVCITSAGIYGFLSNAYQQTANKYQVGENEISVLTNKKDLYDKNIASNQTVIDAKTKRVEQLSNLRTNQESRLDSAKNTVARGRARSDISAATLEIQGLNKDIDVLNSKNAILLDSSNAYSTKAIDSKSKATGTSEIGPLKYLAALTGYPMDKVVNWFILLLIFVFDPLAVALVISFNKISQLEREREEAKGIDDPRIFKTSNKDPKVKFTVTVPESEKPIKQLVDPVTGEINFNYKPVDIERDFWLGTPAEFETPPAEPEPPETLPLKGLYTPDPVPEIIPNVYVPIHEPEPVEEPIVRTTEEQATHDAMRELTKPDDSFVHEPVIPTGKVELNDIKEVKEMNRGLKGHVNNFIERIGSNKILKDGNKEKIFFNRNK